MSNQDKSFTQKVKTFKNNIYGSSKGKVREAVLSRDLEALLNVGQLSILDVGGGQGQLSLKMALKGHQVTIVDISDEMLDVARQQSVALGVESNVNFVHCALQDLPNFTTDKYDLVLCHAVFEWLVDPKSALAMLNRYLTDEGKLSLMFYNADGQLLSNLVYGNFDYIDAGFKAKKVVKLNPQNALKPADVLDWADALHLQKIKDSGVRCFHDYMRDIKHWEDKLDKIIEMELYYSDKEPFASIGRYKHFIFKKR